MRTETVSEWMAVDIEREQLFMCLIEKSAVPVHGRADEEGRELFLSSLVHQFPGLSQNSECSGVPTDKDIKNAT